MRAPAPLLTGALPVVDAAPVEEYFEARPQLPVEPFRVQPAGGRSSSRVVLSRDNHLGGYRLKPGRLAWRVVIAAVMAHAAVGAAQDSLVISGRVVSDAGAPLASASVFLEGMNLGSVSQADGRYGIVVPPARVHGQRAVLVAQLIGYSRRVDTLRVDAGAVARDFRLTPRPLDFGCGPNRPRAPSKDRRPFTADEILDILRAQYIDCGPGPDFRDRVLDDSTVLNYFAALLLGRAPWPLGADTLNALSWLGQAGDARFLPVYLRYTGIDSTASPPRRIVVYNSALDALIHLDTLPEAQQRIRALGKASISASYRSGVAIGLAFQNTTTARALLDEVVVADLSHRQRRVIDSVLSRPLEPIVVPAVPPDTQPAWLADDSARYHSGQWANGFFSKYAIAVQFAFGATPLDKQDAIDSVAGRVIGGYPSIGVYLIQVPTDSTGEAIERAVKTLRGLPQVRRADQFVPGGIGPASAPSKH